MCWLCAATVTYPEPTTPTSTPVPTRCTPCRGWQNDGSVDEGTCSCPLEKLWDGKRCVNPIECPCYEGYTAYSVGSHFHTEDCQLCTCKMGGDKICEEKTCSICGDVSAFTIIHILIWKKNLEKWYDKNHEESKVQITQNKGKESENSYQKLKRSP